MSRRILALILLMAGLVVGHSALAEPVANPGAVKPAAVKPAAAKKPAASDKPAADPAAQPTAGYATLIVSRVEQYGWVAATVELNGKPFELKPAQTHTAKVRGPVVLSASIWHTPGRYVVRFNAQPGKTCKFTVGVRSASVVAGTLFGLTGMLIDHAMTYEKEVGGYWEIKPAQ